uniref:Uncharacterized protein n=1 Tax=Anguilla anguilla TaxID=7936 RepID=A0A0E9XG17_ANGAN
MHFSCPLLNTQTTKYLLVIISPCSILEWQFSGTVHHGECPRTFSTVRFCVEWNRWGKSALSKQQPSTESEGTPHLKP